MRLGKPTFVRFPLVVEKAIEEKARRERRTKSQVIRMAVEKGLKREPAKERR